MQTALYRWGVIGSPTQRQYFETCGHVDRQSLKPSED